MLKEVVADIAHLETLHRCLVNMPMTSDSYHNASRMAGRMVELAASGKQKEEIEKKLR